MSFKSKSSQAQAHSTLNKLLAHTLPGSAVNESSSAKLTSTQIINSHLTKRKLRADEVRKINKLNKQKQNRHIKKSVEDQKKFNKLIKYNIIKKHKANDALTPEEEKYLQKLVKKNSNAVRMLSEIDDEIVKDELDQVKAEILDMALGKSKKNQKTRTERDFDDEIKQGLVLYPGLTPGLAPVGFDSDDEE